MIGAIIGASASLLGTATQIGLGINSLRQNKEALKQASDALTFQKDQYQDQKKNYDGFMKQTQESANSYSLTRKDEKPTLTPITSSMPMDKI